MVGLQGSGGWCECAHHRTEEVSRFLLLTSNSGHIRAFGMNGTVVETEHFADFIEEFWLLTSRRVRHMRAPL
jgi:hypothetical protein